MTSNQPCLIDKPQKLGRNFCSRENWRGNVLACLAFVLQTCLFRPLPCVMYKNQHGLFLYKKNIKAAIYLYEEPIKIYAWKGFYPHVCFTVTALPWNTSKIHFFFVFSWMPMCFEQDQIWEGSVQIISQNRCAYLHLIVPVHLLVCESVAASLSIISEINAFCRVISTLMILLWH